MAHNKRKLLITFQLTQIKTVFSNMLNKQTNSVDSLVCVHSLMQILSVGLKITCSSHSAQHTVRVTIHRGALFLKPCYVPRMSKSNITDLLKSGLLSK